MSEKMLSNSILVIDDEVNMLDMLSAILRREGYRVVTAAAGREALVLAESKTFDFILCDLKMPGMDGLQFLDEVNGRNIKSTVIMMSAFATVDVAVKAMKNGAYDFITKPFKSEEIVCILEKGAERLRLQRANQKLRRRVLELERGKGFESIIGESKTLKSILDLARGVAGYDTTVLITGESGTGKELLARGIHQASPRRDGPFISVNCGAVPENLLESEFFGYQKGAFTGAESDRKGLFEAANGGTLLLDEIGELPIEMQVKLLRVLQEREIRPLASVSNRKIDVRVLAATAKDLSVEAAKGDFRQDLLYRLNVVQLQLPPLRERQGDVPLLVNSFIASESARIDARIKGIAKEALTLLASYSWPGNVRELRNVIEHAVIYARDGWIGLESFPEYLHDKKCHSMSEILSENYSIKKGKALFERHLILKALAKTNGNRSQAAELLEISYPSLLSKIKEYNIRILED